MTKEEHEIQKALGLVIDYSVLLNAFWTSKERGRNKTRHICIRNVPVAMDVNNLLRRYFQNIEGKFVDIYLVTQIASTNVEKWIKLCMEQRIVVEDLTDKVSKYYIHD